MIVIPKAAPGGGLASAEIDEEKMYPCGGLVHVERAFKPIIYSESVMTRKQLQELQAAVGDISKAVEALPAILEKLKI